MEYRKIDLSAWKQVGEGGLGKTYENPDNPRELLKHNNAQMDDLGTVEREYQCAKNVLELGLPTPDVFEIVQIGDGFGTVSEKIVGKKSLSRLIADNPGDVEKIAGIMASEGKRLHGTPCNLPYFKSRKDILMKALDVAGFVDKEDLAKIRAFASTVEDAPTCLHGDFQMGNLIVSGEGKPYWIDLGWFSHGDPYFDLGHLSLLCFFYSRFPQTQEIFHIGEEQFHTFWEAFSVAYTGEKEHSAFDARAGKFAPFDMIIRNYFIPSTPAHSGLFAQLIHALVEKYY